MASMQTSERSLLAAVPGVRLMLALLIAVVVYGVQGWLLYRGIIRDLHCAGCLTPQERTYRRRRRPERTECKW